MRRGIRALLEDEPGLEVAGESGSDGAPLAGLAALGPRVAVLDGRLRDGSGADACRRVRESTPGTAVVVLMEEHDDDLLFGAIAAGAAAVLLRHVTGTALVDAIRRVASGQQVLDPAVTGRVLARVRQAPPRSAPPTHLTPQEEQVLEHLGAGLTDHQIAGELGLVDKTVRNHVSVLRRKLRVETRIQAAVLAGYRSRPLTAAADQSCAVPSERPTRHPSASTSTS